MQGKLLSFAIIVGLSLLASCHSAKQSTTESNSLFGKNWKLTELNRTPINMVEQTNKEAHVTFNASEKRVNGNGSCNSFFGNYQLEGVNGITFSAIGSTKMACPGAAMQIEQQLFQAFAMTNKFILSNDTLLLTKNDMTPLAKFVSRSLK